MLDTPGLTVNLLGQYVLRGKKTVVNLMRQVNGAPQGEPDDN